MCLFLTSILCAVHSLQKKQAALKRKASGERHVPQFKHKKPRQSDQPWDAQSPPLIPKSPQKHKNQPDLTTTSKSPPLNPKAPSPSKQKKDSQTDQHSLSPADSVSPKAPPRKQTHGVQGPQGKKPQQPTDRKHADEGTAAGKPAIKTSSLFKNNPDIPSVQA